MHATLIYNANAGGAEAFPLENAEHALAAAGYETTAHLLKDAHALHEALAAAKDLVVVAGGDGTVRSVAVKLFGRKVPLAILPLGTANNIGRALGLTAPPCKLLQGLTAPHRRYLDLGIIQAPWGEDYFLEAAGRGLFAFSLAHHKPTGDKSFPHPYVSLLQALSEYKSSLCELWLDGKVVSERFLFIEIMNTPTVGPRLEVAPEADPGDGWLDVATVKEENRAAFRSHLENLLARVPEQPDVVAVPFTEVTRAKKVKLVWEGAPFHVDGKVRSRQPLATPSSGDRLVHGAPAGEIELSLAPRALEVWLPGDLGRGHSSLHDHTKEEP